MVPEGTAMSNEDPSATMRRPAQPTRPGPGQHPGRGHAAHAPRQGHGGGTNGQPRQAAGRQPPPPPPIAKRPPIDLSEYYDVHITSGLDDEIVRIRKDGYDVLLRIWMLAGEDVILRARHERHEDQIVLRGAQNGRLRVSEASENGDKKIPMFQVFAAEGLMEQMAAAEVRRGAEKGSGT
jgi:hypothetical protein